MQLPPLRPQIQWLVVLTGWVLFQVLLWRATERHLDYHDKLMMTDGGKQQLGAVTSDHQVMSRKQQANFTAATTTKKPKLLKESDENFHIVFSTDCSGYQHWQGILLYYSALRVKQAGMITRIASGCSSAQQMEIQNEWNKMDPSQSKFRVHFAPSTALNSQQYKYSNKPGGILHWLEHTTTPLQNDTVVCLLDPDMILLRPITAKLVDPTWSIRPHGKNQIEYLPDNGGMPQMLRVKSLPRSDNLPSRVRTAYAAGQHFGIGGAWTQAGTSSARPVWQNFSKAYVCGDSSPCTTTTSLEALQDYAVGPVYLATVQDWHRIAATWWEFVPRVHQQYPYLLAEMYALTMAVAHLQLRFSLFSSYMVTGAEVGSPTEAWSWIDDIVMKDNDNNNLLARSCPSLDDAVNNQDPLPNTLHYCQRYKLDLEQNETTTFLFSKRKIPHNVFSCDSQHHQAVPFDVQDLKRLSSLGTTAWSKTDRRTLFGLCHAVSILNWAREKYRKEVCDTT